MQNCATFLFHGSLNDFLPKNRRHALISYAFDGRPAVKDAIEAMGIPHPEVGCILINNVPVGFQASLQSQDRVAVFPVDSSHVAPDDFLLQPALPEPVKFVLDVHLGKLAKALRMLGFDAFYRNDLDDKTIANSAFSENRIVLTRDVNLLKIKTITWGYWLRSQFPEEQLTEVISHFNLHNQIRPFTRCLECNGLIFPVAKEKIINELPLNTRKFFQEFYQCESCRKVYWKGSHFERMEAFIKSLQLNQ